MTTTKRRIFFIISTLVFFILAGSLIIYSRGYQWQWPLGGLVRTGGIFIRSNQDTLHVSVNGLLHKTQRRIITDKGTLVSRLIPQTYEVHISKEGFYDWYKQLNVNSGTITEAKFVILFPKNIQTELLELIEDKNVYLLNNTHVAYFTEFNNGIKALKIRSLTKNENVIFPLLSAFSAPPSLITIDAISPSGRIALIKRAGTTARYALVNTQNGTSSEIALPTDIQKVFFDNSENLYFIKNKNAYVISPENKNPKLLFANNQKIQAIGTYLNEILFIEATHSPLLIQTNAQGTVRNNISAHTVALPSSNTIYSINRISRQHFLIHAPNESLVLFDVFSGETKHIGEHIIDYVVDSKIKKIAYLAKNDSFYELNVLYLTPTNEQPYHKRYDIETITKTTEPIGDFQLLPIGGFSEHIVFEVGNRLIAAELDGRDRRNNAIIHPEIKHFYLLPHNIFLITTKDGSLIRLTLNL